MKFTKLSQSCLLLAFFVASVTSPAICLAESLLHVRHVSGDVPLDPKSAAWKDAQALEVSLLPQSVTEPRLTEALIDKLSVKGVHNGKEVAFLLEWQDATKDDTVDIDLFSDAAGLQFPSVSAPADGIDAAAMMGDKKHPVNIWFWKMAWQEKKDEDQSYYIADAFLKGGKPNPENEFRGGIDAGNPVSPPYAKPAGNLVAGGFGTLTSLAKGKQQTDSLVAKGEWKDGRWSVVFRRALAGTGDQEAAFRPGQTMPVAFTVWNGSEKHRGGRKVFSSWYEVQLDK